MTATGAPDAEVEVHRDPDCEDPARSGGRRRGLAPKVGPAGLTLCGTGGLAPKAGPAGLTLFGTGDAGGGRHRGPEVGVQVHPNSRT